MFKTSYSRVGSKICDFCALGIKGWKRAKDIVGLPF